MHRLHPRALPAFLLLTLGACAPATEEFPHEPVCGEAGPKRLLELPPADDYDILGPVDDRILVVADGDSGTSVHVVGPCGEEPLTFEPAGHVFVEQDWVFSYDRDVAELVYHDVRTGEQRSLLTDVHRNMVATPLGLVVISRAGGPLLLHPNPSDPSAEPITLLEQTADLYDDVVRFDFSDVWSDGARTFGLDPDGTVHRIDLATAATEPVVTGAETFKVVDDGAQLLYTSDRGVILRELESGDELVLAETALDVFFTQEANDWILLDRKLVHLGRHEVIDATMPSFATIHPAVDGSVIAMEALGVTLENESDFWRLQDDGSIAKLVDHKCRYVTEFSFGADGIVYPDGVALPSKCLEGRNSGDDRPDDILFFPLEGEPYDVGRSFGSHWLVSDNLISWEEWALPNRLIVDTPDQEPLVAHSDVLALTTPVAGEDVFYVAREGYFDTRYDLYRAALGL